jgi:uncharacterized damage-inducible protein DinB
MGITDALLQELEQEAATTRRVLERVPTDKLTWKPHDKSMSLGGLAQHLATVPGFICSWALDDVTDLGSIQHHPEPTSTSEILAAHDAGLAKAKDALRQLGDAGLQKAWSAKAGGQTIMAMPKGALVRSVAMNHAFHHRGQLSVYLRLLDVPVPSIYGPSADEGPFMRA